MSGEITVGSLKRTAEDGAPFFGVPYSTMRDWTIDDMKYQQKIGRRGGVEGKPRWFVEKHQRGRKNLAKAGRTPVLSGPARAALAHEICLRKNKPVFFFVVFHSYLSVLL
jgi:hypothetical protein